MRVLFVMVLLAAAPTGCGARSDLLEPTTSDVEPSPATGPVCPVASTPIPIAQGTDGHSVVEVDDTHVFIGTDGGAILRIAKELGVETSTIAQSDSRVMKIALDATHVTWTTASGGVYRVSKDGGEPLTIAKEALWTRVVVDDRRIYWLSRSESPDSDSLLAIDKDGSNEVVLASGIDQSWWIGADESGVYFSTKGSSPALYRVSALDDALSLVSEGDPLFAFVLDGDVIWSGSYVDPYEGYSGHIERIDKSSGARESVAHTGALTWGIAVDESDIYYTPSYKPPDLLKVPKSGGDPEYWADVPDGWQHIHNSFYGVATDSSAVYWADSWTEGWDPKAGGATFARCKNP